MSLSRSGAVYGRISRDPGQTLEGVQRQVKDLLGRVASIPDVTLSQLPGSPIDRKHPERGHWPAGVFVDNDISARRGSRKKRPEYERMLRHIHGGDIQLIVSAAQSRLWRNTLQCAEAIEDLKDLDVRAVFLKGKINEIDFGSPVAKLMATVMGGFDAYEADVTAERQQDAARHFATGGSYHGARPFGFTLAHISPADGSTHLPPPMVGAQATPCPACLPHKPGRYRTLVPDPAEAQAVREAYEFAHAGISLYRICRYLDGYEITGPGGIPVSRPAIPTAGGHRWADVGMQSLLIVLRAPRNIGKRLHSPGWSGGKRPEGKLYDAHWDAIISEELFYDVQDRLARRQPASPGSGGQAPRHLLTGFAYCGKCGKKLRIHKIRGKRRYACTTFGTGGGGCVSRDAESVEMEVQRILYQWFANSGLLTKSLEIAGNSDLQKLYAQRNNYKRQRDQLADKLSDGVIDDETYIRQKNRKAEQISDVDNEIATVMSSAGGVALNMPTGAEFQHKWRNADLAERRLIIAKFIDKVVIHPIGAGNQPDPLLVQVFPAGWAASVDEAQPAPVPDAASLTSRGKVTRYLTDHRGQWFTRQEIATAAGITLDAAHKNLIALGATGIAARQWRRRGGHRACFMYSAGSGEAWEPLARNALGPRGGASRDTIVTWLSRSPAEWFTLAQIATGTGTTQRHASKILADLAAGRFLTRQKLQPPHEHWCYVYSISGR